MFDENKNSSSVTANTENTKKDNSTETLSARLSPETAQTLLAIAAKAPKNPTPTTVKLIKKAEKPSKKVEAKETKPATANTDLLDEEIKAAEEESKNLLIELPELIKTESQLKAQFERAKNSTLKFTQNGQTLIAKIENELIACREKMSKIDGNLVEHERIMDHLRKTELHLEGKSLDVARDIVSETIDFLLERGKKLIEYDGENENSSDQIQWNDRRYTYGNASCVEISRNMQIFGVVKRMIVNFYKQKDVEKTATIKEIMAYKPIISEQLKKLNLEGTTGTFSFYLFDKVRKSKNWMLIEITAEKEIVLKNISIQGLRYLISTKISATQAEKGWVLRNSCSTEDSYNAKRLMMKLLGIAAPPLPRPYNNQNQNRDFRQKPNNFRKNTYTSE